MSMTKRQMEADRQTEDARKHAELTCHWNWDDKFFEPCDEHAEEEQAERPAPVATGESRLANGENE